MDAIVAKKTKRGHLFGGHDGGNGGNYQGSVFNGAPSGRDHFGVSGGMTIEQHNEIINTHADIAFGGGGGTGGTGVGNEFGVSGPVRAQSPLSQAPPDVKGLAGLLESHVDFAIHNGEGPAAANGASFNFNNIFRSNHGPAGGNPYGTNFDGSFGTASNDPGANQFTGVQGEIIPDIPPSVFDYKPAFGGRDINNLPHIIPPGGKSIRQLQDEADSKLQALVAKTRLDQQEVSSRIKRLRNNYGHGTIGYEGYREDSRFRIMGEIDLGTHRAIDLGTSIDYNALKAPNGKLKLPVQNVYHTKTLGIHVPQPYPVKVEVAVPAPYPVPQPVPYPRHKATRFSPLNAEDVVKLTSEDNNEVHFNPMLQEYGVPITNENQATYLQTPPIQTPNVGAAFPEMNRVFSRVNFVGGQTAGAEDSSFSIQPSQAISETSEVGGEPYGARTQNGGGFPLGYMQAQRNFGFSRGTSSGNLANYGGPVARISNGPPRPEYGVPKEESYESDESDEQSIPSEAGPVAIPSMSFSVSERRPSTSLRSLQRFHSADGKAKRNTHKKSVEN